MRASMHVRTKYFFAGGSAREPWVKDEEYFSEEASTFFWIADIFGRCLDWSRLLVE
jgi:hypothetical protein